MIPHTLLYCFSCLIQCSWTAAAIWAAGATDITAAGVWTTLAPANPNQEDQQKEAKDHQNNQEPVEYKELCVVFTISCNILRRDDRTDVDTTVSPCSLCNIQICIADYADLAPLVLRAEGNCSALLGGHYSYCPLVVCTLNDGVIVGVVLRQNVVCTAGIECSLNRVPTVRLILPRYNRKLRGRCLILTSKGDRLEENDDIPLGRTLN